MADDNEWMVGNNAGTSSDGGGTVSLTIGVSGDAGASCSGTDTWSIISP